MFPLPPLPPSLPSPMPERRAGSRPPTRRLLNASVLALAAAGAGCGGGGGEAAPVPPPPPPPLAGLSSSPTLAGGLLRFSVTLPTGYSGVTTLVTKTVDTGSAAAGVASGYATGGAACATAGVDYVAVSGGSLIVPAGSSTGTFDVQTCPNGTVEANERFGLEVTWGGRQERVEGVIVNNAAGGLNDTGIVACLNSAGAAVACNSTDLPGQDGATGRDVLALTADAADGRVGFSYARSAVGGCVVDKVTGLTWDPSAQTATSWASAAALATQANAAARCSYTDWRVPTTQELLSLVDAGATPGGALIDATFFPATPSVDHWTADVLAADATQAWLVSFGAGLSASRNRTNPFGDTMATRLVRGNGLPAGECDTDSAQRYIDHADGTVSDVRTGLMWQRCTDGLSGADCNGGTATAHAGYVAALQRAAQVNADPSGAGRGRSDWRVPNRNELASLVQPTCTAPALNRSRFPSTPGSAFWTSSPAGPSQAWAVQFNDGQLLPVSASGNRYLRLVRAGQ